MSTRGEVLIAILNNQEDLTIAREQHWYRIPVEQVEKLKKRGYWSPRWVAFYQTKVFGAESHTISYYAQVKGIREVYRWELFPEQPRNATSDKRYYRLELSPLEKLSPPIVSKRIRRITFIASTWENFRNAGEINDL
ncbi:hypothetical protein K9N68_12525 [Kovacikia minuta CCNUW1]|uniref:hypothetical protein n=1 Tax=Kovacikia minuta TaxID=2931930 RepID=UPI001CCBA35D|nr:hypothetical protein [Kovacikia minuta]UBF28625.1 hypothetical protein K9N68_12525 [Kovacikia minuta CCNUW1]